MAIYSEFSHQKWWFSIAMLVTRGYIKHPLNVPNGMWKFPTKPWFLRRCSTWGRDYWEDGDEPWNFGAPYVPLKTHLLPLKTGWGDEIVWFVVVKSNLAMLMPFLMAEDGTINNINNRKSESFIVHISKVFAREIIYVPAFAAAVWHIIIYLL